MSKRKTKRRGRECYRQNLAGLAAKISAYEELNTFLERSIELDPRPAKINPVKFNDTLAPDVDKILEPELSNALESIQPSTLFIVENISVHAIEVFSSTFGVEYEFWLDHISKLNWFRLGEIEKHFPALKQVQMESHYIRYRIIGSQEVHLQSGNAKIEDRLEPKSGTTRVPRVAGNSTSISSLALFIYHGPTLGTLPIDRTHQTACVNLG